MEKFIVSARKYRPQNFSTVVGQSHITTTLKNAIKNNQLAHAFLFCGPRGVGKTTCARILAKTINCENRSTDTEACNKCNSCISFDHGTSLNIHELDAASNNSVEDIRNLVEQVRFAPQAGAYKVYIVDEVHMLSTSAFNAFLKTLEEPPPFAIFILATTEKHKILPTILSRCQIFDFKRITNKDTTEHLKEICDKESIKCDKASLHVIAQKSEGCLRDALSILDKIVSFTNGELNYSNTLEHLNILDEDYYFKMLDLMMQQNVSDAVVMYDEINRKGFEGDMVLNGFAEFLRNILVSKDERSAILLEVAEDFRKKYFLTAKTTDASWIISALNILNEAEISYKQARNKKLHVELTIIKLTYLKQALELVNTTEGSIKKKLTEVRAVSFRGLTPIVPVRQINIIPKQTGAKIIIQPEKKENLNLSDDSSTTLVNTTAPAGRNSLSLKKIKEEVALKNNVLKITKELSQESIYMAWGSFIETLKQKNNPSATTNFKLASLAVANENCIEVFVESSFQQKFIDNERADLIEYLRKHFQNKLISYKITIKENSTPVVAEKHLSTKDQYLKMIEEYPLIKELKDGLRLELDY
ncbi:hypothetical protein BH09BAC2_BH09BAC2_21630 [soil metagenome]